MKRLPPGTILNINLQIEVVRDLGDAAEVKLVGGTIGLAGLFAWFKKHDICHQGCIREGLGGLLPQKCRMDPAVEMFSGGDDFDPVKDVTTRG